jgi:MFS family permease
MGICVGGLLTGVAGKLAMLFLARLLDGASRASVSVAQAAVTDVAAPDQRARLLGLLGAAFGVGFVVGPAFGSLAALGGPRVPFILAGALAGVNALVAARRLPETHPFPARGVGGAGAVEWRRRRLPGLLLVAFLALVAFSALGATFSLLGQRRLGLGLASSAAVFTVIGLMIVLVQARLVHPMVQRLGEGGALRLGLLLDALGLAIVAGVHSFVALAPALLTLTIGQGLVMPTLASIVAGAGASGATGGRARRATGCRRTGPRRGTSGWRSTFCPAWSTGPLSGSGRCLAVLALGVLTLSVQPERRSGPVFPAR